MSSIDDGVLNSENKYACEPFPGGLDVEVLAHLAGQPGRGKVGREEIDALAQQHGGIFGEQQADRVFVEVPLGGDDPPRLRHEHRRAAQFFLQ